MILNLKLNAIKCMYNVAHSSVKPNTNIWFYHSDNQLWSKVSNKSKYEYQFTTLVKIIQNTQFWSFHTFSNLFLPKWYKIT